MEGSMLAKVLSGALLGINAYPVEVEVDIAQGLPQFSTVGLPEGAVKESKDRVKSAIKNSGYEFPTASPSILLQLISVRKGPPSIYPWRSAYWRRWVSFQQPVRRVFS
jgi:magnesium chelatase family protein